MKINELETSLMLLICDDLLGNKDLFMKFPLLQGTLPYLSKTRDFLHSALLVKHSLEEQNVRKILKILDAKHDSQIRVVHFFLRSLLERVQEPSQKEHYESIRDTFLPLGLSVNRLSYSKQVAECKRLEAQLKDPGNKELCDTLKAIEIKTPQEKKTVFDWLTELVDLGEKMGASLQELAKLSSGVAVVKEANASGAKVREIASERAAQLQFFELIRLLRMNVSIAMKEHPELEKKLWSRLDQELAKSSPNAKNTKTTQTSSPSAESSSQQTPTPAS